jgi:hypothetical protein
MAMAVDNTANSSINTDREYAYALAEAMKAVMVMKRNDGSKTKRPSSFLTRFRRRISESELQRHSSQARSSGESAEDEHKKQAERHAAYLRVLNKDKALVGGKYTEPGLSVADSMVGLSAAERSSIQAMPRVGVLAEFIAKSAAATNCSASSSPVSSCSRDTSVNSNTSFDLLDWDGPADESFKIETTTTKGATHSEIVNPFDVFAIAP